jgi:ATP-dependent Lhr-like helicase
VVRPAAAWRAIHRYTLNKLRAEIEPFFRRRLHALPAALAARPPGEDQVKGADGLMAGGVEQLEGFELAAAAWENDVLPAESATTSPSSSTASA